MRTWDQDDCEVECSLVRYAALHGHGDVLSVLSEFSADVDEQCLGEALKATLHGGRPGAAKALILMGAPVSAIDITDYDDYTRGYDDFNPVLHAVFNLRAWAIDVTKTRGAFNIFLFGVSAHGEDHALAALAGKEQVLATIGSFAGLLVGEKLTRVLGTQQQLRLVLPEKVTLAGASPRFADLMGPYELSDTYKYRSCGPEAAPLYVQTRAGGAKHYIYRCGNSDTHEGKWMVTDAACDINGDPENLGLLCSSTQTGPQWSIGMSDLPSGAGWGGQPLTWKSKTRAESVWKDEVKMTCTKGD